MDKKDDIFVVGIGSSAGGLDALTLFLNHLKNRRSDYAIVVTQHMSPDHSSRLTELLQNETSWRVQEISNRTRVEKNQIYITPPKKHLVVDQDLLYLEAYEHDKPVPSVDRFFESLAKSKGNRAIGIILSGTGQDGTKGMRALKENGGYALVQEPGDAGHQGMPASIIDEGSYDKVLLAQDMPNEIDQFIDNFEIITGQNASSPKDPSKHIFDLLQERTGTDFNKYKPSTLLRRIDKRIESLGVGDKKKYLEYIHQHPKELDRLFETVLIGVTEFFRDAEAFSKLQEHLSKAIIHKNKKEIRIWSVGTATGEEAYTIGMMLSEILQHNISKYNVQIFATDIDEKALRIARKGHYGYSTIEKLPKNIVNNYFIKSDSHYEVKKMIRQMVLFCKHDVTVDPPFVHLDLVICRNVLIYFNNELQKEVLPMFHYALNPDGFLFLGKSESIKPREELFEVIQGKNKIYQKVPKNFSHLYRLGRNAQRLTEKSTSENKKEVSEKKSLLDLAQDTYFKYMQSPMVIINNDKEILEIKGSLRLYMELKEGEPSVNLTKMVNPELSLDLRVLISKVEKREVPQFSKLIKFTVFEETHYVRLHAYPIDYTQQRRACYLIVFEKVEIDPVIAVDSNSVIGSADAEQKIVGLEHELRASKEHLQLFTEELETSNEELQSLNEELQSTNEELKSSNEELETSNEELQSTNEELQTANQELRASNEELVEKEEELLKSRERIIESENLYRSIAKNFPNGTLNIVDRNLELKFVDGAELRRLNISPEDLIGKNVLGFHDPDESRELHKVLKQAFAGENAKTTIKSSDAYYSVNAIPLRKQTGGLIDEVIFATQNITDRIELEKSLKEAVQKNKSLLKREKEAHDSVIQQQKLMNQLFENAPAAICILRGKDWVYEFINPICKRLLGNREFLGRPMLEVLPELKGSDVEKEMNQVMETGKIYQGNELEVNYDKHGDGILSDAYFTFIYQPLYDADKNIDGIIFYGNDVTEEVRAKNSIKADIYRLENTIESLPLMAWTADAQGNIEYFNNRWYEYTGQTWETAKGNGWQNAEHPEDLERGKEVLIKHLSEQTPFSREVRYLRASDKTYRWHITSAAPIKDDRRDTIFWIGTAVDIQDQKEIESKKDEFLNIASHELKTPLTSLSAYFQLIEESFPNNLKNSSIYLSKARTSVERITKLIYDLLNLSRIDTNNFNLEFESCDLKNLVNQAVSEVRSNEHVIDVKGEIDREVTVDRFRLLQVLENLLSNAIKFSPDSKSVEIHLESNKKNFSISIKDKGIGISKEDQVKLFDRYYRANGKTNISGLGLGLYISNQIVAQHNGQILVESEKGKGSVFTVVLPFDMK